jgi:uncharacterized membrane protein YfcA
MRAPVIDLSSLALAAGAGLLGGTMNALAGGGTFTTMPTLIALGLPSPVANATSNVALQPLAGISVRALSALTFVTGMIGSLLLVATPARTFDIIVPWLLLIAAIAIAFGKKASEALARHAAPGPKTLFAAQAMLGVYGGYFGGGVGLMMTATWGLLAGELPHRLMGHRTLMLAFANGAATIVFIGAGLVRWAACLPMLVGAIAGGYLGAIIGKLLPPAVIRGWTLLITAVTTAVFFYRAYG